MEKSKLEEQFTKEQLQNCEGLNYLTWDMFDSPDSPGSGYRFMEREPVLILDEITKKTRHTYNVERGYCSKNYADKLGLVSNNSHRVGKAIQLRVVGTKKRMELVSYLCLYGVKRIAVSRESLYFDTDDLKKPEFMIW